MRSNQHDFEHLSEFDWNFRSECLWSLRSDVEIVVALILVKLFVDGVAQDGEVETNEIKSQ